MNTLSPKLPGGVELHGELTSDFAEILTPDAMAFVAKLHRTFAQRREQCLQNRQARQIAFDRVEMPDFLPETNNIREADWTCAQIPAELLDRRVQITGTTDR